jgi:hypothetical protein
MKHAKTLVLFIIGVSLFFVTAPPVQAQITHKVEADIHHQFTVGEATLPPGQYIFRMMPQTDLSIMTVTSADGNTSDEFLVRQATDSHVPHHNELVFNRYGNHEFLTHVYQQGEKIGVAVVEPSREESRLEKQGQTPVEHTEEQNQ